jgi:CheY-like chemotaxis protein
MHIANNTIEANAAVSERRPRLVVADNDPMVRSVLRSLLARLGLDLAAVADGDAAIEAAQPGTSMFLLDLDMPGAGGGLGVCRTLRTRPAYRDVPIAILTGYHDEDLRRRCMEAGATLFLTKPFNPAELLRALAPHLPLDPAAERELARLLDVDRGLRLQDVSTARGRQGVP